MSYLIPLIPHLVKSSPRPLLPTSLPTKVIRHASYPPQRGISHGLPLPAPAAAPAQAFRNPPLFYPNPSPPSMREMITNSPFRRKHLVSINQFAKPDVEHLLAVAKYMKQEVEAKGILDLLSKKLICTMFYEPSTRTATSFDVAMQRLGGRVSTLNVAGSSIAKGETLQDTMRTLASYSDAIVLRHPSNDSADIAARASSVPVINGGNGSREHPTQAFLDLFTITQELGRVDDIVITFLGDLKYGRTVHSLSRLLAHYNVNIQLVSPPELDLPSSVRDELIARGVCLTQTDELTPEILSRTDVLYCTRVQQERFADPAQYEQLKDSFIVNSAVLRHAKPTTKVMHPLPRKAEISEEVDVDPRAAYFRQMRNGLFTRMAILAMVLG